ncbi:hypothetical protein ACVIKO_006566 [Rhizobium ruizarguesonis]
MPGRGAWPFRLAPKLAPRLPTGFRRATVYVRDLVLKAELVHYRRECWVTPDGKTVLAPLPAGIIGGYDANLRRLCLMLHAQGQVTTQRLTTLLNDVGIAISKRQIVRLLTRQLEGFVAEDAALLHAGLVASPYVTVDDTGARHSHNRTYASIHFWQRSLVCYATT